MTAKSNSACKNAPRCHVLRSGNLKFGPKIQQFVFDKFWISFVSCSWLFFRSLSCLERCERLVGSISTKFRLYTSDWFRVMTETLKKLTNIKLTSVKRWVYLCVWRFFSYVSALDSDNAHDQRSHPNIDHPSNDCYKFTRVNKKGVYVRVCVCVWWLCGFVHVSCACNMPGIQFCTETGAYRNQRDALSPYMRSPAVLLVFVHIVICRTPHSMNRLLSELLRKFGGVFLEVFEII